MARTSPVYYIAPSAISITPNANGSQRDLAVYVAKGTKIKVCYQPISDLGYDEANYKEWTLSGRNRRLADANVPYTIYARLKKTDQTDGYLVFAKQTKSKDGKWKDPYILSPNTSATSSMRARGADDEKYLWDVIPDRQAADGRSDYWWIKLGTVSLADLDGKRTVELDTGILGTDQYNKDWYLDPDLMPEHPVKTVYEDRGEWTLSPKVKYTGETGSATPDGTLKSAVAESLGWSGRTKLSFTKGADISEPYHYRHLTRNRWIAHRLSKYNAGYTDAELYEKLTMPSRGWEEENWVETSRVWLDGKLWECLTEGTTEKPGEKSKNWKLLIGGAESAYNVELTKSSDAVVIDPSGNVVGGYRTVSKDSKQNEFYTYRFFTSVTVMKGGEYLHLCGALDDEEELGDGNFTVEAIGAGCELKVEGSTVYITYIWHCNDGDASTDPYTSYNRTPEEYQLMRAMTEAVAHITLNIEGKTSVTKDYRLQLVHLPTDTITIESHNEIAAVNWSTKRNAWTNNASIVIPLTASSGGQPVRFQTVNGGSDPDIRLLNKPGWLSGTPGFSVAWADYDEDGDGRAEYKASQHMCVEITIPIANILRTWQENGTTKEIPTTNLLKFNVTTVVDGVEYENVVPFTLNVTTDKAVYVLAPSVRQVTGTMIGGTWDPQTNTVSNARYSYVAAGVACSKVTCKLLSYDSNNQLTEITSASDIHDDLTFFINGVECLDDNRKPDLAKFLSGIGNDKIAGSNQKLFDTIDEIVFAIKLDGKDYESEGVPILRNGAQLSVDSDGYWNIGGVPTEVYAEGTKVVYDGILYTDPMPASTPPPYEPENHDPPVEPGEQCAPYVKGSCPDPVDGMFIHYVTITKFSDSEETYVYAYGTVGTGNTITVIHDRDFYASPSELTQNQLEHLDDDLPAGQSHWKESTPDDYSSTNKYLYARDTARYYKNGAQAEGITVGGITYPKVVYTLLSYWGQDGSGVEFAYYRAADDTAANKPTVTVLTQNHPGVAGNPVIDDWTGSDGGWYDDNPGFTARGQVMYQSVNKYMNGQWSGWQTPVIIDRYAEDGTSPWIADLDNEVDSIQVSETGYVVKGTRPKTVASMYYGSQSKAFEIKSVYRKYYVGSQLVTVEQKNGQAVGEVAVSWPDTGQNLQIVVYYSADAKTYGVENFEITVSPTDDQTIERKLHFTINAITGDVYNLIPSDNNIHATRDANDNLVVGGSATYTLTCSVKLKKTGEVITINTYTGQVGSTQYYVLYRLRNADMQAFGDYTLYKTGAQLNVNTHDAVELTLCTTKTVNNKIVPDVTIDRETIYVVADGKKGDSITKSNETYKYGVTTDTSKPSGDGNPDTAAVTGKWYASRDKVTPLWTAGRYLWTETTILWSDGSTTVLYSDERNPNDGVSGQDIIVDGATVMKYSCKDSNTIDPTTITDWADYGQVTKVKGKWLWSKATTNYKKATTGASAGSSVNYNVSYIATDGTSPYFADIDNEMDSIPCTNGGVTTAAYDKYINVSLWHGATQEAITTLTTSAAPTNVTITPDATNKRIRVKVSSGVQIAERSDIAITVASANSGDKTLHFILNGVCAGANGQTPTLFSIEPSVDSIKCDKSGALTPPSPLTVKVKKITGSTVADATASDGTLRYLVDGDITSSSDGTSMTIGGTVAYANTNKYITLAFFVGTAMRDKERIPIVYDGTDGEDGRAVTSVTEYYKATNSNTPMPAPTEDTGWDTDPNLSGLTDKWDANHIYLWNYEKVTYSKGTTVERTTPSIIAIWTKNGDNGKGIDSITNKYCITDSANPPSKSDPSIQWYDDPVAPTEQQPYLWNYEIISWVNPTGTTETDVQLIGHYGADGNDAVVAFATPDKISVSCDASGNPLNSFTTFVNFGLKVGETTVTPTDITLPNGKVYDWVYTGVLVNETSLGSIDRAVTIFPSAQDTNIAAGITFTVERKEGGVTKYSAKVTVALICSRQGPQGTGEPGHTGRWYYYAGEYSKNPGDYAMQETQAPYVNYGAENGRPVFWMLDFKGNEPSSMPVSAYDHPTDNSECWTRMASEQAYYIAEAIFGSYAHLGSFIINGDWMISQYGKQYNPTGGYTENSAYTDFNRYHPGDWDGGTNFVPNFAVDGKTGKVYMQKAYVQGEVHATSGEFTGTLRAQMMFSNVLFVQSTPYTINLASAPANIFYTAEQDYTINLPSAGLYDGLILRFIALCQPAAGHFAIKLHSKNEIYLRTKGGTGSFSTVHVQDIYTNNYVACSLISIGAQWHPLEGEFSSNSTYFFG